MLELENHTASSSDTVICGMKLSTQRMTVFNA